MDERVDFDLDDVRAELEVLVNRRIICPLTGADRARYRELTVVERRLLGRAG